MGKRRANNFRRVAEKMFKDYPDQFSLDFEKNKKSLAGLVVLPSSLLRNKIAGHMVTLVKSKADKPQPDVPTPIPRGNDDARRRRRGFRRRR